MPFMLKCAAGMECQRPWNDFHIHGKLAVQNKYQLTWRSLGCPPEYEDLIDRGEVLIPILSLFWQGTR